MQEPSAARERSKYVSPTGPNNREFFLMLGWALTFLVIAIIAGVFGFGGVAATSAGIAQVIFVVFLILFALSLIAGLIRRA